MIVSPTQLADPLKNINWERSLIDYNGLRIEFLQDGKVNALIG